MPRKSKQEKRKVSTTKRRSTNNQNSSVSGPSKGLHVGTISPTYSINNSEMKMTMGRAPLRGSAEGIRVVGRQPFANIVVDVSGGVWDNTSAASIYTLNTILINPLEFRGRLGVLASTYERFIFRRLTLRFTTTRSTSTEGSMALCYHADGNLDTDAPQAFSEVRQTSPNVTFNYYSPQAVLDVPLSSIGDDLYYVSVQASSSVSANMRQKFQGAIIGYPWSPASANTKIGYLDVEYVIDLYNPTFAQVQLSSELSVSERQKNLERRRRVLEDGRKAALQDSKGLVTGGREREEEEERSPRELGGEDDVLVTLPKGPSESSVYTEQQLRKMLAQLGSK